MGCAETCATIAALSSTCLVLRGSTTSSTSSRASITCVARRLSSSTLSPVTEMGGSRSSKRVTDQALDFIIRAVQGHSKPVQQQMSNADAHERVAASPCPICVHATKAELLLSIIGIVDPGLLLGVCLLEEGREKSAATCAARPSCPACKTLASPWRASANKGSTS
jgi:hypothetical protein